MKTKVYVTIFFIFLITIGVFVQKTQNNMSALTNLQVKDIYNDRIKEYQAIINEKKNFLNSFAKFIASSPQVINGYLDNNREEIIKFIQPLYNNLHKNELLTELHLFKKPAISFVNFANLNSYNFSVAKSRADIMWIDTSFTPSDHFYVCRLYPGLRATYPIIYKDILLGSVSFGIDVRFLIRYFNKMGIKASIYLNNKELKNSLLAKKYNKFKKLPIYKNYRVEGKMYKINLSKKYELKGKYLFINIKIKDFFGKTMGYLVLAYNMAQYKNSIKNIGETSLFFAILLSVIATIIILYLFNVLFKKLKEMNQILEYIKKKEFAKIPQIEKPKDEIDIYKNNLIEVSKDIEGYLNLLTDEVKKYHKKAYIDGLTKVYNRLFLEEHERDILLKAQISNYPLSMIMFDIDNFKKINDTYGHDVGDLVLVNLTKEIHTILRKNDYFIRYGGEEFVIILPDLEIDKALIVAEKIRKKVEEIKIKLSNGEIISFTISIGISHLSDQDDCLFEAIKRADEKLYIAKKDGKNRVKV